MILSLGLFAVAVSLLLYFLISSRAAQEEAESYIDIQQTYSAVLEYDPPDPEKPAEQQEAGSSLQLPYIAADFAGLRQLNPDTIGWIRIDGTKLDYPVMWTPDDKFKYDHLSFEEEYDYGGVPYMKYLCSIDPPTDNLIIYGHNMANGSQFRTLVNFQQKNYWLEHPTIYFSTLYEEREYEIMAVFLDRIYKTTDTCFKYYNFIDPETEEEFNEGIQYFKDHALYDTGVTAEYGDQLITLVTCAYHVDSGRLVVVGRLIEDEPAEELPVAAE